ncbi:hypothetical protein XELAEV_18023710mg [Xenopus laevis]|uniref:Uncharacterized protein n=1 Tax=Xenopus laevis TaxID=8355 RepID=A0A974D746_XENLA|nr:hypothetical protein XELAEV_18023710mg [Xenopus laevis]
MPLVEIQSLQVNMRKACCPQIFGGLRLGHAPTPPHQYPLIHKHTQISPKLYPFGKTCIFWLSSSSLYCRYKYY